MRLATQNVSVLKDGLEKDVMKVRYIALQSARSNNNRLEK